MTPFKAMCNEQWALSSIGQLYSKLVKMDMDYIFGLTVLATLLVHLLQVTTVFQAH